VFGTTVHATKRDYDYFAELDQRLSDLRAPGERTSSNGPGQEATTLTIGPPSDDPDFEP
jgi:hypothetical protein